MATSELTTQLTRIEHKLDQILELLQEQDDDFIPSSKREPDEISRYFRQYMKEHAPR